MSLKKALGMGVASAALGISLIGGGTFAAFTDTETVSNSYAAGTLNLELKTIDNRGTIASNLFTSTLANFKPGDTITKTFLVANAGTLSIKDVKVQAKYEGYLDGSKNGDLEGKLGASAAENSAADFASQIKVEITSSDVNDRHLQPVWSGTLEDLQKLWTDDLTKNTDNNSLPAIPADRDKVRIKLTFDEQAGNTFQGDKFENIKFQFYATQFSGKNFNDGDNVSEFNARQTESN